MAYDVILYAYCGMPVPIRTNVDFQEARSVASDLRKRRKQQGYPVTHLGGNKWEIETPDDAIMIGDREGILEIEKSSGRYA